MAITELPQEEALQAILDSCKALSTRYSPEKPVEVIYDNTEAGGLNQTKLPDRFGWLILEGPLTYYLSGGDSRRDIGVIGDNEATDEILELFKKTSATKLSSVELGDCQLRLRRELIEFPSFGVVV